MAYCTHIFITGGFSKSDSPGMWNVESIIQISISPNMIGAYCTHILRVFKIRLTRHSPVLPGACVDN